MAKSQQNSVSSEHLKKHDLDLGSMVEVKVSLFQ